MKDGRTCTEYYFQPMLFTMWITFGISNHGLTILGIPVVVSVAIRFYGVKMQATRLACFSSPRLFSNKNHSSQFYLIFNPQQGGEISSCISTDISAKSEHKTQYMISKRQSYIPSTFTLFSMCGTIVVECQKVKIYQKGIYLSSDYTIVTKFYSCGVAFAKLIPRQCQKVHLPSNLTKFLSLTFSFILCVTLI